MSRHTPVIFNLNLCQPAFVSPSSTVSSRICYDSNKAGELNSVISIETEQIYSMIDELESQEVDLNTTITRITDLLYDLTFGIAGQIFVESHANKKEQAEWFNSEYYKARAEYRSAETRYSRDRNCMNNKIEMLTKRRDYNKVKRRAKLLYNKREQNILCELAKTSPGKFWKKTKRCKNVNYGELTLEDFVDHFKQYSEKLKSGNYENAPLTDINENNVSFETSELDEPIMEKEIYTAVDSLKRNKSTGLDELISEICIDCKNILSPILVRLFNFIFHSGVYPESWSCGVLVPIPKKETHLMLIIIEA